MLMFILCVLVYGSIHLLISQSSQSPLVTTKLQLQMSNVTKPERPGYDSQTP